MKNHNHEATDRRIGSERENRRNFLLGVANGAIFMFAETLISPALVLTWFVDRLTDSNLLIGLVAPLGTAGWFLPQMFVSGHVQRMRRKMPLYTACGYIRVAAWFLLAATVWLVDDPAVLLGSFFLLYSIARLVAGPAGLVFLDVVAKTIPPQRRGRFFAWRHFTGGLLALGSGWIINVILDHPALSFPRGHACFFLLYGILMLPSFLLFTTIREPPGASGSQPVTAREQLGRMGRVLREDRVYRRYMLARLALTLTGIALPFYGVYAKSVLQAPDGMIGIYTATSIVAQLLFNLVWGWVSDLRGNRLVMRLLALGKGLTALLALLLVGGVALLAPRGAWLPYLALPLFFLDGALISAGMLSGSNFLLDLIPEQQRPLYLGLSNTLTGIVTLVSAAGGLLVDAFGFGGLFAAALALCSAAYVLATGLPDPRQTET